jgi:hypothetical protein
MNRSRLSPTAIRRSVELQCGKISDEVWQYAVDDRMVSEVANGESDLNWLIKKILGLQRINSSSPSGLFVELDRRQRRTKLTPSRIEAISRYVASQARENDRVKAYRRTFLGDRLLSIEEVEDWIRAQSARHPYQHRVIIKLPPGVSVEVMPQGGGYTLTPPLQKVRHCENLERKRFLHYVRSGDARVKRIPAPRDGPIGALYDLSESLAETYCWQQSQATAFVLTDLTPEIEDCAVSFEDREFGGLARIHVVVDPSYTPMEVAKMYKQVRSQIFKPRSKKGLSEKHTRLALLVMDQPELDVSCLRSWNARYPRWAYTKISRFRKEAARAYSRLEAAVIGRKIMPYEVG